MDAVTIYALVRGCALVALCTPQIEALAGVVPFAALMMTVLYLSTRGRSHQREAARQRQQADERRQVLLQKLTFFLSSLRHVYNTYPPDQLPPALQAERQAFLDNDFRNLTTLSTLSLAELEDLFTAVQRECATGGKWQGGVAAVERRVEEAVRRAGRPQDMPVRGKAPDAAPDIADDR